MQILPNTPATRISFHRGYGLRATTTPTGDGLHSADVVIAQRLKDAPSFDKDHWPAMADAKWGESTYSYYSRQPYWSATHEVVEGDPAIKPSEH